MNDSLTAILIFISFCIVIIFFAICKKIFYKIKYKKRYSIFPRTSIKGITNIAMVISLSVAILILLTIVTSNILGVLFRAFPGTRITVESILIKIGGLLFGPFIGLFIGMFTDLLSVTLTAGVFHYGYFIAAMCYGLLSGLVRAFIVKNKTNKFSLSIYSSIVIVVVSVLAVLYFTYVTKENFFIIPFFSFPIEKQYIILVVILFSLFSIMSIWFFYFISLRKTINLKNKMNSTFGVVLKKSKDKKDYFTKYCPVITCIILCEMLVNVLIMPAFDADISTLNMNTWLAIRLLLFVPMVILNTFIIYPVYIMVSPLVIYDYKKDMIEDPQIPLYIKN